jgi:hypothetical protein
VKEKKMAKTKIAQVEDGLKNAAIAVGSAIGNLAHKVGIGGTTKPEKKSVKKAVKKALASKAPASSKKAAAKKKTAIKKVAAKVATKSPAKKK